MFNKKISTFFGDKKKDQQKLDSNVLALAKLSIEVYSLLNKKIADLGGLYEDNGKFVKIVGGINVSPVGVEGRWMVNFTTTNLRHEDDWGASVSSFIFDFPSRKLDESYPARKDHSFVAGKSGEGKYQIIGTYGVLAKSYEGRVAEGLKAQGWKNIGEIWAADVNRFSGILTPPAANTAPVTK